MSAGKGMRAAVAIRVAVGILLVVVVVAGLVFLPVKATLVGVLEWVQGLGVLGAVVLGALYVPACLFLVPGTLLTLGAGFAFGVVVGSVAVSIGSTLGAAAAFLAGRTLARDLVESRVARSPRFAALDRAVGRQGFKIVLLTRLSPVFPFTFLNYAYGLTRVSLRDYVLATWIGMLPATIVYVYVGSAIKSLADLAAGRVERGPGQTALFLVGMFAAVVVAVYVARLAQREFHKAIRDE